MLTALLLANALAAPPKSPADHRGVFLDEVSRRRPVEHPEADYRFYADLLHELAPLVAERPGVIEVERIGRTVQGHRMWAFHVTDPSVEVRQKVLVTASIHPMEWVGAEAATELLLELAQSPVQGVQVTVVPMFNVDGRLRVEQDLLDGVNRYWRTNSNGVDLNRDFTTNREAKAVWRHLIPNRYTTSPGPLSQPETQAIDALAERENYVAAVSFHAFGGYIYHPWAGLWERTPDQELYAELGRVMQSGQGARAYRSMQLSRWAFFFRGHGMELDHLYAEYGTMAFLIELTRTGYRWRSLRADRKVDFRMYNPPDPDPDTERGVGAVRALLHHIAEHPLPDPIPAGHPD